MISGKTQNPMPPNKTDEELANDFANHFLDKIEKIRSKLTTTKPYTPKAYNTPDYGDSPHSLKTNYVR